MFAKHSLTKAILAFLLLPAGFGLQGAPASLAREATLKAAREMMVACPYCAMASLDGAGGMNIRTMNPFPPDGEMVVWFATSDASRKVEEIRRNPKVALYYSDHKSAAGYVALYGKASLVSDPGEIKRLHRAYWDQAFPGGKHLLLIKVVPERMEVIDYKRGLGNDEATNQPPMLTFPAPATEPAHS